MLQCFSGNSLPDEEHKMLWKILQIITDKLESDSNKFERRFVWYYDKLQWSIGLFIVALQDNLARSKYALVCNVRDGFIHHIPHGCIQEIKSFPRDISTNFDEEDIFRNLENLVVGCRNAIFLASQVGYVTEVKEQEGDEPNFEVHEVVQFRQGWKPTEILIQSDCSTTPVKCDSLRYSFADDITHLMSEANSSGKSRQRAEQQLDQVVDDAHEMKSRLECQLRTLHIENDNLKIRVDQLERVSQQYDNSQQGWRTKFVELSNENRRLQERIEASAKRQIGIQYLDSKFWDSTKILKKLSSLREQQHENALDFLERNTQWNEQEHFDFLWRVFRLVLEFYKTKYEDVVAALSMDDDVAYGLFIRHIHDNFLLLLDLEKLKDSYLMKMKSKLPVDVLMAKRLWQFVEATAQLCWAVVLHDAPKLSFYPSQENSWLGDEFVELDAEKYFPHPSFRLKRHCDQTIRVVQFILPGIRCFTDEERTPALPCVSVRYEDRSCLATAPVVSLTVGLFSEDNAQHHHNQSFSDRNANDIRALVPPKS